MSELMILGDMVRDREVPVSVAMNALRFTPAERKMACEIAEDCAREGFCDFIVADPGLIDLLCGQKRGVHVSGEYGELNSLIMEEMQKLGVKRIIFPRQTTVEEMERLIGKFPGLEYEAFLFNEKCHYTGAYCNSPHFDELCHSCRIPYRVAGAAGFDGEAVLEDAISDEVVSDDKEFQNSLEAGDAEIPGTTGCGLCKLWQYRRIGITHLKLVRRGNATEATLRDLEVVRRALRILDETDSEADSETEFGAEIKQDSEEKFIARMKKEIFPEGCGGVCY